MVDFSTLGKIDPAQMKADEAERRERFYQGEEAARDAASKKALTITLAHEPEMRFMPSGDRVMLLRGVEDGRTSPLTAVYVVPTRTTDSEDREAAFDQTLRGLGGGDRVSLAGQWAKRGWNDQRGQRHEAWEFKTQIFAAGDVPLDRMLENARAERLGADARAVPEKELEHASRAPKVSPALGAAVGGAGQSR